MVCDLNHRLATSEASVGRKKSCGQLKLKVRGGVLFAIRWTLRHQQWASACGRARCFTTDEVHLSVC
jgi:hypothetical protein